MCLFKGHPNRIKIRRSRARVGYKVLEKGQEKYYSPSFRYEWAKDTDLKASEFPTNTFDGFHIFKKKKHAKNFMLFNEVVVKVKLWGDVLEFSNPPDPGYIAEYARIVEEVE